MMKQIAALIGGRNACFIKIYKNIDNFYNIIENIIEMKENGKKYFFIDELSKLNDLPYFFKRAFENKR